MKVGGLRTVGPSTVRNPGGICRNAAGNRHPPSRLYMLQGRRGIPHRKPPVLFLAHSICWDQLSILEIIGAGRPRPRTRPLRQLQERATFPYPPLKQHAALSTPVAVTAVTSCPSSTPTFFGRRVSFKRDGGLNGQKIALTAIVDQTNNFIARADPRPSAVLSTLSDRVFDRCFGRRSNFWHRCRPRRRYFSQWQFCVWRER